MTTDTFNTASEISRARDQHAKPILDDWLKQKTNVRPRGEFTLSCGSDTQRGSVKCNLTVTHHGNWISADGFANTTGDAFFAALIQIEKTIGVWS
jgi:hypothetical protein